MPYIMWYSWMAPVQWAEFDIGFNQKLSFTIEPWSLFTFWWIHLWVIWYSMASSLTCCLNTPAIGDDQDYSSVTFRRGGGLYIMGQKTSTVITGTLYSLLALSIKYWLCPANVNVSIKGVDLGVHRSHCRPLLYEIKVAWSKWKVCSNLPRFQHI